MVKIFMKSLGELYVDYIISDKVMSFDELSQIDSYINNEMSLYDHAIYLILMEKYHMSPSVNWYNHKPDGADIINHIFDCSDRFPSSLTILLGRFDDIYKILKRVGWSEHINLLRSRTLEKRAKDLIHHVMNDDIDIRCYIDEQKYLITGLARCAMLIHYDNKRKLFLNTLY